MTSTNCANPDDLNSSDLDGGDMDGGPRQRRQP
jgi:hypothetical protein